MIFEFSQFLNVIMGKNEKLQKLQGVHMRSFAKRKDGVHNYFTTFD